MTGKTRQDLHCDKSVSVKNRFAMLVFFINRVISANHNHIDIRLMVDYMLKLSTGGKERNRKCTELPV